MLLHSFFGHKVYGKREFLVRLFFNIWVGDHRYLLSESGIIFLGLYLLLYPLRKQCQNKRPFCYLVNTRQKKKKKDDSYCLLSTLGVSDTKTYQASLWERYIFTRKRWKCGKVEYWGNGRCYIEICNLRSLWLYLYHILGLASSKFHPLYNGKVGLDQ